MKNRYLRRAIKTGKHSLTFENVRKLLSVIDSVRDEALFTITLDIGARRDDIVNLKITDIDFNEQSLNYFQKKKGYYHKANLESRTMTIIEKYLKTRKDDKVWLFPSTYKNNKSGHLSGRMAYKLFHNYLLKAEIIQENENKPFHSLRSTCIKLKQKAGWTPLQTAEHIDDTLRVIENHYSTPTFEEMKKLSIDKQALKEI